MATNSLDRIVALTRDLIVIPSTEDRPHERARCFAFLRNHLESVPGIQIREFERDGFGSLTVMPMGIEQPAILMVGHLDVICHPHPEAYRSELRDGRIYGPGAGDMKGQCAIMLDLFCTLQRLLPGLSLGLAYTSDEERGGEHGVGFLFEKVGLRCGMAIVPDGGSVTQVTTAEKGILHLRLHATGRESHAARPWLTSNPLTTLINALGRIGAHFDSLQDAASPDHWYPTCAPTMVNTDNRTINCIPGEVEAYLDIRFPPPFETAGLRQIIADLAGPGVELTDICVAPPSHLAPDDLYLRVTEEVTGATVELVRASGGSDARFIAQFGIPVILSRPLVGNLHGIDEWIDVESMGVYHRICERFILKKLQVEAADQGLS